ncbi:MAG: RluA family pseudouridine synthase [Ruminococcaceae bacterium]|nr:RluA family pseudouridine synthase [Oscillospiraceae bacterium]
MLLQIDSEWHGCTVQQVLRRYLGLSSGMLRHVKYLDQGILCNGEHVTVRHVLQAGDVLSVLTEDRQEEQKVRPVQLPLSILYEDSEVVVPDKPAFMPTHPSHDHYDDTVANALAFRYAPSPFVFRPINRLDRNTSGALLIARNRMSAAYLCRAMQAHEIRKQYIAVLDGVLHQDEGTVETHLRRTAQSIIVREVCSADDGDYALTHFRVLRRSETHTVVLAEPVTGRTHQLRVHFAHLGCPITGDDLYGTPSPLIGRHALHAQTLSFPHPVTHEVMTLSAPLHADMERLIAQCFDTKDGSLCTI